MSPHTAWVSRVATATPEERGRLWALYRIHVTEAPGDHDTALASLNEQLDKAETR